MAARVTPDPVVTAALDAEEEARAAADGSEATARAVAVSAEATSRTTADSALGDRATALEGTAPTVGQKAALAGTGTPGSGNKFVTADGLASETSSRSGADTALGARIDAIPNVFIDVTKPPYNAIGDDGYHALSERYATLADAQAVYPDATALTDQIDWAALMKAVRDCNAAGAGVIYGANKRFITQKQIPWSSRVHFLGVSTARVAAQGHVGTMISTFSGATLQGSTFTATVTTVTGTTTLSLVSSFADLRADTPISGVGIRPGTSIVSVNTGAGTAVLSHAATADGVGVVITPGKAMINTSGCVSWSIRNVTLSYAGVFGNNCSMAISDVEGGGAVVSGLATIADVTINNFGGHSVAIQGNVMFIRRNRFDFSGGDLIRISASGATVVGSDGFIGYNSAGFNYGNGSSPGATGDGLHMNGGYYAVVDNDFYNCQNGMNFINSLNNRAIGNRCEKNDLNGIAVQGSSTQLLTLVGNITFNNGYVAASSGINIFGGAKRVTVSGNIIYNDIFASGPSFTATTSTISTTITVVSSFANLAANHRVIGTNVPVGTYVLSINSGAGTAVLSATPTGNGSVTLTTLPTLQGIGVSGGATECIVTGNLIFDVDQFGINVNSASYNTFGGNMISTVGNQGIIQGGTTPTGNTYVGNYIYNAGQATSNTYDGVLLNTGTLTMVQGNSVFGPATAKVRFGFRVEAAVSGTHLIGNYAVGGNYVSGCISDLGSGTIRRGNRGDSIGAISVSVPSSGAAVAAVSYDRTFFITANAAGATTVTLSSGPAVVIPASQCVPVPCQAQRTLTYSYTNAPTQVVDGYAD